MVEAVGAGRDRPSRRATGWPTRAPLGAYASARLIAADRLVRLPDAIPDEVAATLMLKGMTAQYLIHTTFRVEPGMTVLVQAAAGGVGLILGQWLAAKGATAIGTAGGPEKVALARAHGYAARDRLPRRGLRRAGQGDHRRAGRARGLRQRRARHLARARSPACGCGACSPASARARAPIEGFALGDLAAGGSLSACRPTFSISSRIVAELEERANALFAMLASGAIRAEVHQRFALADVAEAHRALEARRTSGATVLIP